MSYKRSRSTFEAGGHAPFALFGTPLPEESERDENSYLPVWKQDVRDERGRKRLHGAFTGGWSAGYFNTVGSKEGWTPSTFVSSRSDRRKDDDRTTEQRAEDYMDDEDLADAAESQRVQTSGAFAGLGDSSQAASRSGGLLGLFRADGDTVGYKLLRRMGWKTGQGIGPRVKRAARLDDGNGALKSASEVHSFAPTDVAIVRLEEKTDKRGLGFVGESKLSAISKPEEGIDDDNDRIFSSKQTSKKASKQRSGIGMGVLNDTGSDDEDVYEMGPKISYNRTLGGDKKKKKVTAAANPSLRNTPVFMSKSSRLTGGLGTCHDGRLPLDGFILARAVDNLASLLEKFAPPSVPEGWKSALSGGETEGASKFKSTADAAKESTLNPKERAAILGEKALPGKSVFDFLSTTVRDQLVSASGNANLPPARGEIPAGHEPTEAERKAALAEQIPLVDRDAAIAAIARGSKGPYADNDDKRARYKAYLDHVINSGTPLPEKLPRTTDADFVKEMTEYYNCARIFKPMTGFMASRFTTAKSTVIGGTTNRDEELISKPTKKEDPAEEAAKVGMYGALTRTISDFYPTRLLCKRFNVRGPDPIPQESGNNTPRNDGASTPAATDGEKPQQQQLLIQAKPETESPAEVVIDPSKNDALEGSKASADVLAAIFGDSDDDE